MISWGLHQHAVLKNVGQRGSNGMIMRRGALTLSTRILGSNCARRYPPPPPPPPTWFPELLKGAQNDAFLTCPPDAIHMRIDGLVRAATSVVGMRRASRDYGAAVRMTCLRLAACAHSDAPDVPNVFNGWRRPQLRLGHGQDEPCVNHDREGIQ